MSLADEILAALREQPTGLSDGALSRRLNTNHVYINQVCRRLADQGAIMRDATTRPLLNRLAGGTNGPPPRQPVSPATPSVDVLANVATYLGDRNPESRYASFDYCFNYFRSFHEGGLSVISSPASTLNNPRCISASISPAGECSVAKRISFSGAAVTLPD
jgi:hypothetical protein